MFSFYRWAATTDRRLRSTHRLRLEALESREMLSVASLSDWSGAGNTSGANNYVVTSPTTAGGTFQERVTPSAHLSDGSLFGSSLGSTTAFDFAESLAASGTISFSNPSNVDPNIFFGFYNSAGTTSVNTQRLGLAFADSAAGFFRVQMQAVNGTSVTTFALDTNGTMAGGTQQLAAGSYTFNINYTAPAGIFTVTVGPMSFSTTLAATSFQVPGNADRLDSFGFLQLNTSNVATTYTLNIANISYTGETQVAANPPLPGDYNDDAIVDAADFVVWRIYSGTDEELPGDGTPGIVDQDDYNVWRANFGRVLSIPTAPSNLSATAVGATQINLIWTDNASDPNNEASFAIERATNSTFTTGLSTSTVRANSVAHVETGLAAGTTYYFRVRAANAAGESANSNVVSETTLAAATPPAAPSSLVATAVGNSQINLTWTDNASNPNSETGFKIDRATNETFTAGLSTVATGANATSYSVNGLAAGTTYYFRVRSTNAAGDSAHSNTAGATTTSTATSTFYLNLSTGNDITGNGTIGAPWKTMLKALQMAPLGTDSTVYIASGNYTERQQILVDPTPTRTGLVTFKPISPGTVTLTGTSVTSFTQIDWKNVKNVRLEGLKFNKSFLQIIDTENFEFVNNDVADATLAVYGANGALVEGNTFHDYTAASAGILFRSYNTFILPGDPKRSHRADNVIIRNNNLDMSHQPGDAIHVENGTNALIEKNAIKNVATTSAAHGDSIQLVEVSDSTITGNIMSGGRGIMVQNHPGIAVIPGANKNLTFTNNVHASGSDFSLRLINAPYAIIVNNTFWGSGVSQGSGLDINSDSTNVVLVNNVLRALTVRTGATFAARSNNLINTIHLATRVATEIGGTPTFVNYANGNLRLSSGSLGINSGISGPWVPATDFDGQLRVGTPDLGAFEFQP